MPAIFSRTLLARRRKPAMLDPTDTALNRNDFSAFYEGRPSDLNASPLGWTPSTYFHFVDSNVFAGVPEPPPSQSTENLRLHDELLKFCRDQGLEDLARHAGLIQHGEITALKNYSVGQPAEENVPESKPEPARSKKRERKTKAPEEETKKRKRKESTSAKNSKKNKGLRHFSMKVCEKVESKRTTTYNEVADELVAEFKQADAVSSQTDQKNIRRRVYDALNVLMAMGIISKEKKDIRWIGIPTGTKNTPQSLMTEREQRAQRIARKREHLEELTSQHLSYTNLLARNAIIEKESKGSVGETPGAPLSASKIHLPFIIINTRTHTEIECEMAEDHTEYFFNFSLPFEIHDDCEILKRAGMDKIPPGTLSSSGHLGVAHTQPLTSFAQLQQHMLPPLSHHHPHAETQANLFPPSPEGHTIPPNQIRNANI